MPNKKPYTYFVALEKKARAQDLARIRLQASRFNIKTAEFLKALRLPRQKTALDLGTGAGEALPYLSKYVELVIACDYDPKRFLAVRETIARHQLHKKVKIMRSDITALNFKDNSLDLVYARLFWQHLTEEIRQAGMKEVLRVLKKGGWFIAEDLDIPSWGNRPVSSAHRRLAKVFLELYHLKGTEPRMGAKLSTLSRRFDLKVIKLRKYQIKSLGRDPFKRAHVEIFRTTRPEILSAGLITSEEFDFNLRQYEEEIKKRTFLTIAPTMHQIAAQKIND